MFIGLPCPADYAPLRALDDLVPARLAHWQRPAALRDEAAFVAYCGLGCSYIARDDKQLLGYLFAQPLAFNNDAPLTIWVDALAVHPGWRRRGVALQLYAAIGRHKARGAKGVLTHVPPHNLAALQLHRRIGFVAHHDDVLLWRL